MSMACLQVWNNTLVTQKETQFESKLQMKSHFKNTLILIKEDY